MEEIEFCYLTTLISSSENSDKLPNFSEVQILSFLLQNQHTLPPWVGVRVLKQDNVCAGAVMSYAESSEKVSYLTAS